MYLPTHTVRPPLDPVVAGATITDLDGIADPHVALALWTRPTPVDLMSIDLATVDDLSFSVTDTALAALLRNAGYAPPVATMLADDIAYLAAAHRRLAGTATIKGRLDVIETDACCRFHADYVTLRMLCTYRGAGTQWCRSADPAVVHQVAEGTVAVFKGRAAMEEPAILHRSPPLTASGGQRLLLVLDRA